MTDIRRLIPLLVAIVLVAGCNRGPKLASTPSLFLRSDYDPFVNTPPAAQSNKVELHYITDREPINDPDEPVRYGFGRSRSLAIGTATVSIGRDVAWDDLVQQSLSRRRSESLRLRVDDIREVVRTASSIPAQVVDDGQRVTDPKWLEERRRNGERISELLTERLKTSPRKELFVFVHGFNNTFDDACYRMAQLWHFMGRAGVPVVYTWPAGRPGLLRGYQYDRESGEFTVFHLREALRLLADCEAVEKIHIVAHSRGTDVAMSALRELHIGARAAGVDTRERFKLGTVVLAAADLDIDVVSMRIAAEGLQLVPERLVMYLSEDDRAIGLATWLFASARRLGQLTSGDLPERTRKSLALFPEIQFIDVEVTADWLGHGYFISNPAVLSDLILVLRDNRLPGAEHGRPLDGGDDAFWLLRPNYPQFDDEGGEEDGEPDDVTPRDRATQDARAPLR